MAKGIKDKVAILGMGCSKFGERWNSGAEELMLEAFVECLQDAGIDKKQIQAAWFSTAIDEVHVGKSGIPLSTTLRLPNIPVTHVENMCASGTEAFRGACYAVASGAADFALALGVGFLLAITLMAEAALSAALAWFGAGRRLSMIASSASSSRLATARARTTPPTSGLTTIRFWVP